MKKPLPASLVSIRARHESGPRDVKTRLNWSGDTGVTDAEKRGYHDVEVPAGIDRVLPAEAPKRVLESGRSPLFSPHGDTYQWAGKRRLNPKKPNAMNDDRYSQIFEDLTRDLFAVAKRHGKRALREAVRDAANGNLLQEEGEDESIPPEELDYPDEDVWTLPPPADEREEEQNPDDEHELSDAAEKVLSDLMDRLKEKAEK